MSEIRKRGERRVPAAARQQHSRSHWQGRREVAATPAAEASVAFDELRSALATLGRRAAGRVALARTDRARRDAEGRQERASRLIESTWPRVIRFLDELTSETRRLS